MKAIPWILKNTAAVTDLLTAPSSGAKSDAIYIGHAVQGQEPAYITIESSIIDHYPTKGGARNMTKKSYSINIYETGFAAVKAIAEKVEAALDNKAVGTYNTQYLQGCKLVDERIFSEIEENNEFWLIQLTFEALVDTGITSYTAISVFTYVDTSSGTTLTFTPSVTGDVDHYKIADSDTSNYSASGAVLNTATGIITGTQVAELDFEVLAIGSDGLTIGAENVYKSFGGGGGSFADIDDIITPSAWMEAADATNSGGTISAIAGKGTKDTGNYAPISSQPYYNQDAENDPFVSCSYRALRTSMTSDISQPFHMFFRLNVMPSQTSVAYIFGEDFSNSHLLIDHRTTFARIRIAGTNVTFTFTTAEWAKFSGKKFIGEIYADGVGNATLRINGGSGDDGVTVVGSGSSTADLATATNFGVGARGDLETTASGASINEYLIYEGTLSTDSRQDIEGILARKGWSQSGNNPLASDHPHKSSFPTV